MDKSAVQPFDLPSYRQLQVSYDSETQSLWYYLNPHPRPTFNTQLLADIRDFQTRVQQLIGTSPQDRGIRYLVLASAVPDIFNLGGDLVLFEKLIQAQDRDGLMTYGRTCVDAVYQNASGLGVPGLTTISLVQGTALGGGFEAALSSHTLIAEQKAQMGFPEILFNLFPGMGAYSLLRRRVSAAVAERLLRSGTQVGAEELHRLGIVDDITPPGGGVAAVRQFMRRHARARNGHLAIQQLKSHVNPVSYKELLEITELWVETALRVTPRDLRTMARLANIQYRLPRTARLSVVQPPTNVSTEQEWQEPADVPPVASTQ
jgi:DSF synthase